MCSFPLSWRGLMGERARVIRPLCFSDLLYFLWLSRYHTGLVFPLPFSTPFLCPHCRLLHDLNRTSQASVWSSFSSYTTTLFGVRVCWEGGAIIVFIFRAPRFISQAQISLLGSRVMVTCFIDTFTFLSQIRYAESHCRLHTCSPLMLPHPWKIKRRWQFIWHHFHQEVVPTCPTLESGRRWLEWWCEVSRSSHILSCSVSGTEFVAWK